MCTCNITICKKCTDRNKNWITCTAFDEYRKTTGNEHLRVETTEWIDEHGSVEPTGIENVIRVVVCPMCKNTSRGAASKSLMIASVEAACAPLAGLFRLINEKKVEMTTPWKKTVHDPFPDEDITETEPETDVEKK